MAANRPLDRRVTVPGACIALLTASTLGVVAWAAGVSGLPSGGHLPEAVQVSASEPEAQSPAEQQQVSILDLDGQIIKPLAGTDALAVLFVFTRSDCPISNRYAPELQRLYQKFSPLDITFWLVYVDPEETAHSIRTHLKEYGYPFGALRDPKHELVRLTGARVTPEVAVFVPDGTRQRMVYRGRIDDKYVDFGKERPEATTHDLEYVLDAILDGKPVKTETTPAVGCFISDLRDR